MLEPARGALYPVLPLRDIVVFPHMIVPLFVGREKSVRALEDVMKDDKQILLVTQKNAAQDDPTTSDIYIVGTVGTVLQLLKLPDGTVKVLVEGGPVEYVIVPTAGLPQRHVLGRLDDGHAPVVVAPGGSWKGLRLVGPGGYALMVSTVTPAWTPRAISASPAGRRTSSFAAAKTSQRWRSRTCCFGTRQCAT